MSTSGELAAITTVACALVGGIGTFLLGWPAVLGAGSVGALLYALAGAMWWVDRA